MIVKLIIQPLFLLCIGCGVTTSECYDLDEEEARKIAIARVQESKKTNSLFERQANIIRVASKSGSLRDHTDVEFSLKDGDKVTLKIFEDCSSNWYYDYRK